MRIFFLLVFIIYLEVSCDKNKKQEDFVATNEWKSIKKGQKVPSGLHYRINLETGSKEAKLIEEENVNNRKDLLQVLSKDEKEDLSVEKIKKVLKNIKSDDVQSAEKINTEFRSYEQLKEELGVLNLTSKVDAEIIKDLLSQHKAELNKDKGNEDSIINILEDFDYLAHQFDNGLEFANQNGFRDIIYKNLNVSSDRIKQKTLILFGSLVQNNARVQIHALETGSIPILLRFLSSDASSKQLKSNAMFALGCLLRRFPLAQHKFTENGGVFVILQLFEKSSLKIQLKIITLMSDLIIEKRQFEENSNQLVINQYKLVNLENQLIEQNWCIHIDKLLLDVININLNDHDSIEKVLSAMHAVSDKCKNFDKKVLKNLKTKYEELAKIESKNDDNFFRELFTLCLNILNHKIMKIEL